MAARVASWTWRAPARWSPCCWRPARRPSPPCRPGAWVGWPRCWGCWRCGAADARLRGLLERWLKQDFEQNWLLALIGKELAAINFVVIVNGADGRFRLHQEFVGSVGCGEASPGTTSSRRAVLQGGRGASIN